MTLPQLIDKLNQLDIEYMGLELDHLELKFKDGNDTVEITLEKGKDKQVLVETQTTFV